MTRICFVDTETTGLDPERHEPWEIALVVREIDGSEREYLWQVRPDLTVADAKALEVGRFWTRFSLDTLRTPSGQPATAGWWSDYEGRWKLDTRRVVAMLVARLLAGAHLAGANPAFDAAMLTQWLRANGAPAPTWHHRLLDVEAYAAGAMGLPVPVSLSDTAAELGLEVDREQQHGALYDAHLAKQVYDAATRIELPRIDLHLEGDASHFTEGMQRAADKVDRVIAGGGGARG